MKKHWMRCPGCLLNNLTSRQMYEPLLKEQRISETRATECRRRCSEKSKRSLTVLGKFSSQCCVLRNWQIETSELSSFRVMKHSAEKREKRSSLIDTIVWRVNLCCRKRFERVNCCTMTRREDWKIECSRRARAPAGTRSEIWVYDLSSWGHVLVTENHEVQIELYLLL